MPLLVFKWNGNQMMIFKRLPVLKNLTSMNHETMTDAIFDESGNKPVKSVASWRNLELHTKSISIQMTRCSKYYSKTTRKHEHLFKNEHKSLHGREMNRLGYTSWSLKEILKEKRLTQIQRRCSRATTHPPFYFMLRTWLENLKKKKVDAHKEKF